MAAAAALSAILLYVYIKKSGFALAGTASGDGITARFRQIPLDVRGLLLVSVIVLTWNTGIIPPFCSGFP